ncbi:MAG: hypothetical protein JO000_13530 [Alphaproteobacteria bacterium]|nr:hypothetical protein [Alphaproteobacteria bacterium]
MAAPVVSSGDWRTWHPFWRTSGEKPGIGTRTSPFFCGGAAGRISVSVAASGARASMATNVNVKTTVTSRIEEGRGCINPRWNLDRSWPCFVEASATTGSRRIDRGIRGIIPPLDHGRVKAGERRATPL